MDMLKPPFALGENKGRDPLSGDKSGPISVQEVVIGAPPPPDLVSEAARPLPLMAYFPTDQQRFVLSVALAGVLVLILAAGLWVLTMTKRGADYITAAAQMQVLSQKIAKSAQQVLAGQTEAVKELSESRDDFADLMTILADGGDKGAISVPATTGAPATALDKVRSIWEPTRINADSVLQHQQKLAEIAAAVKVINQRNPELLDIAEQVVALKLQTSSAAREISLAGQLVMLTQRMAKNANTLLASDVIDPENSFLLDRDAKTFRDVTRSLLNGSDSPRIAPTRDPETQSKLQELDASFKDFSKSVSTIIGNLQSLLSAKQSARALAKDSPALLAATSELGQAYESQLGSRIIFYILMGLLTLAAIALMYLIGRLLRNEDRRRVSESELQTKAAESSNKQNQDAILRLMNEMGSLADGDLTVRATVTEDITGAIADSVNYTIEELRVLVGRINSAAEEVTTATESAQGTSARLLQAAEVQSRQIQEASASVLRMARAINDVSGSASRSVNVARQSLAAAEQGASAVQNSISGMNEIRGQIQDTSKRIKRLGESSQQIGEIVELISDITERTQVLALNAAIQAAAAGEAGRGFTVVAEEVQRLAERSADSTRQISAIVKTIQTDTQDAVSAMERSTQGVVDGARLSDAAGQALHEIGDVSKRLTQLIEDISVTAQTQAQAAGTVATNMQDILTLNKQTTEGTKQTTVSVGQLAKLAQELKSSVSNFKI